MCILLSIYNGGLRRGGLMPATTPRTPAMRAYIIRRYGGISRGRKSDSSTDKRFALLGQKHEISHGPCTLPAGVIHRMYIRCPVSCVLHCVYICSMCELFCDKKKKKKRAMGGKCLCVRTLGSLQGASPSPCACMHACSLTHLPWAPPLDLSGDVPIDRPPPAGVANMVSITTR